MSVLNEPPGSEAEVFRRCFELLEARLPTGWSLSGQDVSMDRGDRGLDALMLITSPSGEVLGLGVEVKRLVERRAVALLTERLEMSIEGMPNGQGLVMARYLSPSVREAFDDYGMSYIDVTGNIALTSPNPAIFLRDRGADSDPWRGRGRPRGTLTGEPAAKVVRTLIGSKRAWSVRALVAASKASTGATYRVLEFLQEEELVTKNSEGQYAVPGWPRLLRRWSHDYSFVGDSQSYRFIEPRGLPTLLTKLAMESDDMRYAVTGTLAAAQWAPYAPARAAMIYVKNAQAAAAVWGLRTTDTGANVILAEPKYDVVFEGSSTVDDGYVVAAIPQVAVDLLTGPGRNPSEGEELIEWMVANENSWRRN